MGGVSRSAAHATPSGELLFTGAVSTANNGGFASVRCALSDTHRTILRESGANAFSLTLRGDGTPVLFRVRTSRHPDASFAYESPPLNTQHGRETVHIVRVASMRARWRGRDVPSAPPLDAADAEEVSIMVTKAQRVGEFGVDMISMSVL